MLNLYWRGSDQKLRTSQRIADVRSVYTSGEILWLDLEDPTEDECEVLWEVFDFHPLTIEDCFIESFSPKVDDYGRYLFIVVHGVDYSLETEEFRTSELDLYLGEKFLVTFHYKPHRSVASVRVKVNDGAVSLGEGPALVLHRILDALVDNYSPAIENFEKKLDGIEEQIYTGANQELLSRIFTFKREVLHLRRIISPQREIIGRFSRGEFTLIPKELTTYFRDIHDHMVHLADTAEVYREMVIVALDSYLSSINNKLNEVMKTLTVISTIILPLSLIAGIYGMNFRYMPELQWRYGYFAILGLMLGLGFALFGYFKWKRKWF